MQQMIRTNENDAIARLRAAEAASRGLNISLLAICRDAGVSYPTVRRWLRGDHRPLLQAYNEVCCRLEASLSERREQMRTRLDAFERGAS